MNYKYKAVPQFWKSFSKLPAEQQARAREVFKIFKSDPFHASLKSHRINSLSAAYKRTIYSAKIEWDLRAVFFIEGDTVYSVDIGTHSVYQ